VARFREPRGAKGRSGRSAGDGGEKGKLRAGRLTFRPSPTMLRAHERPQPDIRLSQEEFP